MVPLAAAATEVVQTDRPLEEELRELVSGEQSQADRPAVLHNQSGLNGLATNGVKGLSTVCPATLPLLCPVGMLSSLPFPSPFKLSSMDLIQSLMQVCTCQNHLHGP